MASGKWLHSILWPKGYTSSQLCWRKYTSIMQYLNRTFLSPKVVGHARCIHSSLSRSFPRGNRAPFAATAKANINDEYAGTDSGLDVGRDEIKDEGLAGTYIIGRTSKLGSLNKRIQTSSLKSITSDNFEIDEMFYDDVEEEEKLRQQNQQPERAVSSKSFTGIKRKDEQLQSNEEGRNNTPNVKRRRNEYNKWSYRDEKSGLGERRQHWEDSAWFSQNSEKTDNVEKKLSRMNDSSSTRITSPKVSEAFQFAGGDLLADDDGGGWTRNRVGKEENHQWKQKRKPRDSRWKEDESGRESRKNKRAEWWSKQGDRQR